MLRAMPSNIGITDPAILWAIFCARSATMLAELDVRAKVRPAMPEPFSPSLLFSAELQFGLYSYN
jgi:hypothetical protein